MMIDILAIGAHPDDIELSCSGTIIDEISRGRKVEIADLTKGELGTRGNAEVRFLEAQKAAEIMGVSSRVNLEFKDGFIKDDEEHIYQVVKLIREKRPRIILCNAVEDRHPDHGIAAELVKKACFYSGLIKFKTTKNEATQKIWRPNALYNYIQFKYLRPDFLIDISDVFEHRMKSILAYGSQFYDPNSKEPDSMISSKIFLEFIDARAAEFGRIIGVKHAEGFNVQRIPAVKGLFDLK